MVTCLGFTLILLFVYIQGLSMLNTHVVITYSCMSVFRSILIGHIYHGWIDDNDVQSLCININTVEVFNLLDMSATMC